ncbi:ABC transporter permease subunit [Herbidospora cretacea]|uniref:ABC transporter permease subunit n=1 Tax=Herbidospora cretacea TaxID=28444 RepID=UPI000774C23A|nr:ABC transporter permease subunit [Herbidospora cretacea]
MSAAFADTVRSEWTKFRTIPANIPTLLSAVVLMVGAGALTANGAAESFRAGRAPFDATYISMYGGFLFAQLTVGALGVLTVTHEYATGLIRTSATVVPRRGRLLAAKVVTYGVIALAMGLVSSFGAYTLGQTVIAAGGAPAASLSEPGVLRAVVGMGLIWALVGLVGVALGMLIRATMAATTVLVAVNFIIPVIGPRLLPDAVGDWVTTYWPISAGLQITTTVQNAGRVAPWTGLGVMAGFTVVLLAAAFALFRARDT